MAKPIDQSVQIEKICQILFLSAAEGLIVTNKTGQIIVSNPRANEMFGYDTDELNGLMIENLIPMPLREKHVHDRGNYNQNPRKRSMGIGMNLLALRKDNSTFPVEISLNHLTLNDELMIMALISDITERKKADDKLHELNLKLEEKVEERTKELNNSQEIYRSIARNFPNGTINVFDKDLNYVFVEGQELYKLGITSKMLVGTNYLDRLDIEIRDSIKHQLLKAFDGNDTSFVIEHKNNFYRLNAVGLKNDVGVTEQVLVVEQNITQQKLAEQNMKETLDKERELNELKSRFVSMASHEFRTPLSTILSSADLLDKYQNPKFAGEEYHEKKQKHLTRIKSSVHNLTGILNDFLSLDKLTAGKVTNNPSEFNIKSLIEDIIDMMNDLKKQGQTIIYNHSGNDKVFLDIQTIKNIAINLISNAIKYSEANKEIIVHSTTSENTFELSVKDQGIGIPEVEQKHMFERFFRAGNVTNIQGTGLGLNIVKKYLDLMNGSITFTSKLNQGTTFYIKIPLER